MEHSQASDRLSAEDAIFFYLDTKDMPLHIAGLMVFDGPIRMEACMELVASKLPLIPRYRQKLTPPPFNMGHPTWEFDQEFDIRRHFRSIRLRRGTDKELQTRVGRILSEVMDRSRPLWDITVFEGLAGGRGAMLARMHHCLADGVAGIGLLNLMFDSAPRPADAPRRDAEPSPAGSAVSLVDAVLSSYSEMVDRFVSIQSAGLNIAQALLHQGIEAANKLLAMLPDIFSPVDRLPFNKACLGPRKLVWTEVSLADVNTIREALGGKLNDVVLTVFTGAVRSYVQKHREPLQGRALRMMVPVNIRGDQSGLGNRISCLPVRVPLDIADPVKLLNQVSKDVAALKASRVWDIVSLAGNCIGILPAPLQAALGPLASQLPFPIIFNTVCTNVPGPPMPLHVLGRKMLASYPYVPIGAHMGMCCAIQSYDGKLFFGFTGSDAAAPDVAVLPRMLDRAFARLLKAARSGKAMQPAPQTAPAAAAEKHRTVIARKSHRAA